MSRIFRIVRPSNTIKNMEEKHFELAWAAINEARRTLDDNPVPDTFAGRKTQEPFPSEEREEDA